MAKKEKWQPETAALSNNPFAALSGLKKETVVDAPAAVEKQEIRENASKSVDVKLPKFKSARIERAHHGGKTVTVVQFHGDPSEDAKLAWLQSMKKFLGVGGAIEDGIVMLQGDQRERLKG